MAFVKGCVSVRILWTLTKLVRLALRLAHLAGGYSHTYGPFGPVGAEYPPRELILGKGTGHLKPARSYIILFFVVDDKIKISKG